MLKERLLTLFIILCLTSCYSRVDPEKKIYPVAKQDRPSSNLFYPVRSVRPENPTAPSARSRTTNKIIIKAFHYQLGNVRICEAAKALALSLNYDYYCAPTLFATKTKINQILTPYEFADWLEKEKNIRVVIDRISREVRFLHADSVPARLPRENIPNNSFDLNNDDF